MRPRLGKLLVGPIALLAVTMMASPMFASLASATPLVAAYGPITCTLTISITPNPASAGDTITVVVSGTCSDDTITIVLHSTPVTLGTLVTDANGNASGTLSIPTDVSPGPHTITASDASGNSAAAPVTVTPASTGTTTTTVVAGGAGATTSSAPLAFTGTDAAALGAVGAGVLGVGGLLLLSSRKRRRSNFS